MAVGNRRAEDETTKADRLSWNRFVGIVGVGLLLLLEIQRPHMGLNREFSNLVSAGQLTADQPALGVEFILVGAIRLDAVIRLTPGDTAIKDHIIVKAGHNIGPGHPANAVNRIVFALVLFLHPVELGEKAEGRMFIDQIISTDKHQSERSVIAAAVAAHETGFQPDIKAGKARLVRRYKRGLQ